MSRARCRAEPQFFVFVFERRMNARTAVVNLNGGYNGQSFWYAPIRLARLKNYLEEGVKSGNSGDVTHRLPKILLYSKINFKGMVQHY